MESSLTRKQYRKRQERFTFYGNMKKSAAVVGTTVTACSLVAPIIPIHNSVHAEEVSGETASSYETTTTDLNNNESAGGTQTEAANEQTSESSSPAVDNTIEGSAAASTTDPVKDNEDNGEDQSSSVSAQNAQEESAIAPSAGIATFSRAAPANAAALINKIGSLAKSVAAANNLYGSVMVAQAILESGSGSSILSLSPNNNLFGIKGSYHGSSVTMRTQEYLNGKWVTVNAAFRKYPSYRESLQDNAALLSTNLYRGAWKSNTKSYRDATAALTGLYATAPTYNKSLNSLIESYNLTRFDTGGSSGQVVNTATGNSGSQGNKTNTSNSATGTYTVKSGDSVWLIANKYGISMDQLRSWNNIKNNFIYPGQKLKVSAAKKTSSSSANKKPTTASAKKTTAKKTTKTASYTVKSGDSVWLIANKYGISMDQLRSWNNIKNNLIYPGQKLKVKQTSQASQSSSTKKATTQSKNRYQVKSGDSLWGLSQRYKVSINHLKKINQLTGDMIYVGQTLKIS
ncbi:MAG TPA: LysM peptidoglycan-binding domain-containing protein [Tetragenococcus sp.]|nr:LysM peptidoglycan-binding domain-containing protein [Tetragenococcus sp.]